MKKSLYSLTFPLKGQKMKYEFYYIVLLRSFSKLHNLIKTVFDRVDSVGGSIHSYLEGESGHLPPPLFGFTAPACQKSF